MRVPTWETSAGALAAFLNSRAPLSLADLYTVTLASGQRFQWTSGDVAVTIGSRTFGLGPGITRSGVRFVVGVEVTNLTMTLTDIVGTTVNGTPLLPFIRGRGFYGARVQLEKLFCSGVDATPVGALMWFTGRVSDCEVDRDEGKLTVRSDLELLNVKIPKEVYQPGCLNTLYDPSCGLARDNYRNTLRATSNSDARRINFSCAFDVFSLGGYALGVIRGMSGANAGVRRTVKQVGAGVITVLQPWPAAVAVDDTFEIWMGCDKTLATCGGTFNNRSRFRGQPFIPVPETVI
tara:strand:+ start:5401 stop:6276 length:876 start_codon:yes stop_codon:yes gene_type:complete